MEISFIEKPIELGHPNRGGYGFTPRGVVWHRTAGDNGGDWLGGYFGRDYSGFHQDATGLWVNDGGGVWRYGSSHLGVDDIGIWRYIPFNEVAWHVAGDIPAHNRNFKDLGVEDCQYHDDPPRVRPLTYALMVKLAVWLCQTGGGQHPPRPTTPYWTPRGINPDDGEPYFARHSDYDPVSRPNDPGDYLRWDDFLTDIEHGLAGELWMPKGEDIMDAQDKKDLLDKMDAVADAAAIYAARVQRGVDVVTGKPYDAAKNGADPAPEVMAARNAGHA